jgi:predicted aconitase with swiveling domain
VADLKITELAALAGADLAAGDLLAIADISASETKKITVTDFLGNAVTLIADATIPGAKILFGSATIPGSALEEGAVNTSKLAAGAVTAAKLADESTVDLVTALPVSGAFIGQLALDTSTSKAYIWNGSSWVSFKAAGSINTAIGSTAGVVNVTVTTSGDQITIGTTLDDTANAAEFLAGPSGAGGAVSYRAIVGADLPVATTTAKGGVQVNGNGLTMSGDTLAIDNTITPNTTEYHLIQYDGNGLVTDGRQIQAGDLPLASVGLVGAVYPGTGLSVSSDGEINHTNVIAAGTATKITFDAEGHVTAGDALADTDIPNISAGKLTSGTLDVARIANRSIEGEKLADYATAKISNAAPTAEYIGQLFFNPLDRTLFMWDGNVYQPIGVSFGQIIFSGTYDANTNLVSSVTTDGAAIGLAVGASLVSPTGATRAHYVVVDIAGTGTAPAPAVALAPPDIILSTGTDWTLLDVSDTVVAQLASNVQVTPAGTRIPPAPSWRGMPAATLALGRLRPT